MLRESKNKIEEIELQEFISNTLVQIVKGVNDAQRKIKETNGEISPTGLSFNPSNSEHFVFKSGRGWVQKVNFDLALTVKKENTKQAGIMAVVGVIGASGRIKENKQNESLCRVQFSIPVLLPSDYFDWSKIEK